MWGEKEGVVKGFAQAQQEWHLLQEKSGVSSCSNLDSQMIPPRSLSLKQVTQRGRVGHAFHHGSAEPDQTAAARAVLSHAKSGVPLIWPLSCLVFQLLIHLVSPWESPLCNDVHLCRFSCSHGLINGWARCETSVYSQLVGSGQLPSCCHSNPTNWS